ncbi:MAG TPA: adenylate/guanylate cyclase domain-containing protein, partial [Chloroflexia bacterium]|nr:adenylate/guanylate cyclase domain-containing protein [Chloroflexia bacterium]
ASIVKCIEGGADDYLFKPIQTVLLTARIRASLERKHFHTQEQVYLRTLQDAQARAERLLHHMLPGPVAERLKQAHGTLADAYPDVTVLFADLVDFTGLANEMPPIALVELLNTIFSSFDLLARQYGVEKIKTMGDAYMAAGGLPMPRPDHAEAVAELALAMQRLVPRFRLPHDIPCRLRIGIHTGPVVAGVIGHDKFSYDLWGDTVNLASRMESQGQPGRIQVTPATYERLQTKYQFEAGGPLAVKGRGDLAVYFLTGRL